MQPGKYHDVAAHVLAQGLIDLKLCKGSLDAKLSKPNHKTILAHQRPLQPLMCMMQGL
jgi:hypothetical protein